MTADERLEQIDERVDQIRSEIATVWEDHDHNDIGRIMDALEEEWNALETERERIHEEQ